MQRTAPIDPNEPHDIHEHEHDLPARTGRYNSTLQLRQHPPYIPYSRPSTSSGSQTSQVLRRTPNLEESQLPFRPRSTSSDSPPRSQSQPQQEQPPQPPTVRFAATPPRRRANSTSAADFRNRYPGPVHPALRISRGRASAIQWVLETAIREPKPFTPVLAEENAQMSDLTGNGGRVPATTGGGVRGPVPVTQGLQQPPPIPESAQRGGTGSPSQIPAGMRTPRTIMAERQRRAEAAEQAKLQAEQEERARRQLAEDQRRRDRAQAQQGQAQPAQSSDHRRRQSSSAGQQRGQTGDSGYIPGQQEPSMGRLPDPPPIPAQSGRQRTNTQSQREPRPVPPQQPTGSGAQQRVPQVPPLQPRQPQQQPQAESSRRRQPSVSQEPPVEAGPSTQPHRSTQSSFPHAFERWEELSSHWEGLTSFWIHKLEHDAEEVQRVPLGQQMSRQITDLAAAGANLFHAVVELQRLRASSERKFQRWFFETRTEMERSQEMNAELERQIRAERERSRGSGEQMGEYEKRVRRAEKIAEEARRELAISKDEAKRAWEELGRRESEERDRVAALRDGVPILIGGVQVFPTMAGASRQASLRQQGGVGEGPSGYQDQAGPSGDYAGQEYAEGTSPTDTDPFTETRGQIQQAGQGQYGQYPSSATPATSTASQRTAIPPASQQQQQSQRRQQQSPPIRHDLYSQPTASAESEEGAVPTTTSPMRDSASYIPSSVEEDTFSASASEDLGDGEDEYEIDENGNIRYDAQGRPILWRRGLRVSGVDGGDDDEMDVADEVERERQLARQYGTGSGRGRGEAGPSITSVPTYPSIPPSSSAAMAAAQTAATIASRPGAAGIPRSQPPQTQHLAPQAPMPPQVQTRPDYEGEGYEGYQPQPPWEALSRHHHPTRLSDVPEEDERSRVTGE